jgi:hypothetical protein
MRQKDCDFKVSLCYTGRPWRGKRKEGKKEGRKEWREGGKEGRKDGRKKERKKDRERVGLKAVKPADHGLKPLKL